MDGLRGGSPPTRSRCDPADPSPKRNDGAISRRGAIARRETSRVGRPQAERAGVATPHAPVRRRPPRAWAVPMRHPLVRRPLLGRSPARPARSGVRSERFAGGEKRSRSSAIPIRRNPTLSIPSLSAESNGTARITPAPAPATRASRPSHRTSRPSPVRSGSDHAAAGLRGSGSGGSRLRPVRFRR